MNTLSNTAARARCCAADLRFLLSITPEAWVNVRHYINVSLRIIERAPDTETINAAWRLAAIIHDKIRNA